MSLSEERQSHWARIITDSIWNDDLVDYSDEDLAFRIAKKTILEFVKDLREVEVLFKIQIEQYLFESQGPILKLKQLNLSNSKLNLKSFKCQFGAL